MSEEKKGIENVKEAFLALNELSLFLICRLKDGIGIDDALALFDIIKNDEEFKALFLKAYADYDQILPEIKNIDASEGIELALLGVGQVKRYLDAFAGNC